MQGVEPAEQALAEMAKSKKMDKQTDEWEPPPILNPIFAENVEEMAAFGDSLCDH